jgi:hypothetical protein
LIPTVPAIYQVVKIPAPYPPQCSIPVPPGELYMIDEYIIEQTCYLSMQGGADMRFQPTKHRLELLHGMKMKGRAIEKTQPA